MTSDVTEEGLAADLLEDLAPGEKPPILYSTDEALTAAIVLAVTQHAGQRDKSGKPYILHPLRVMAAVADHGPLHMMAAVMHDVVEDTSTAVASLLGFPEPVVEAVDALSRRDNETYRQFIDRCAKDGMAVVVKIADLEDNMRLDRSFMDMPRLHDRYIRAWLRLRFGEWPKNTAGSGKDLK